jgi:hypothetical protein
MYFIRRVWIGTPIKSTAKPTRAEYPNYEKNAL